MKREKKKQEEKKTKLEKLYKILKDILEKRVGKWHVRLMGDIPMWYCHRHMWVDSNTDRIMKAQALSDNSTVSYMAAKKHLEINADHCGIAT